MVRPPTVTTNDTPEPDSDALLADLLEISRNMTASSFGNAAIKIQNLERVCQEADELARKNGMEPSDLSDEDVADFEAGGFKADLTDLAHLAQCRHF